MGAKFRVGVSVKPVALKPWVASGTPVAESGATMPPVPGVKRDRSAVAVQARAGAAVVEDDLARAGGFWTTTVEAPAVVAGVAVVKVMLPVWVLSPMVTVPLAVV